MKLSEINALQGTPCIVRAKSGPFKTLEDVPVQVGDRLKFSTAHIEARGSVLAIDHGATYPIQVEWFTESGDKRITSFAPDEFIHLQKE